MSSLRLLESDLAAAAQSAVERALAIGADGASATARSGGGVRVTVRRGDDRPAIDTAVRDLTQSLAITVLRDGRSGSASTAALDAEAIRRTVAEATTIAAAVQPDPDAGLPDPAWLAFDGPQPPLAAPANRPIDGLIDLALATAQAVEGPCVRLDEAGIVANESRSALVTSAGFCRTTHSSYHALWAMVLAEDDGGNVRDFSQSSERRFDALDAPSAVAGAAVALAKAQRGARSIPSHRGPVLFAARTASAIVSDLVAALSGGAQVRQASALPGAAGRMVAPTHIELTEDPFEPYGLASGGYDPEGIAGTARTVIRDGVVQGYFLGSRAARRLGLRSTGNAGGPWNLRFASREGGGDAETMRQRLGTGLLVTRLNGGGTDPVRGTWTRSVSGLWVEGGEVVHAVTDVTVAGTLPAMLAGIVAIGDEAHRDGAIRSGSILIDEMQVGGSA
ncbi:TldD/PmbA family protein [Sphingomonas sp. CLY1604]|uniref:TldD/PmbA family protein n=1 Tax=Sphingomonas sp. CLY1604 TaxID=3457786 RepID=UPI003FD85DED